MRKPVESILFSGALATVIQQVVYFVNKVLLIPVFLLFWGVEKYGIWIVLMSVLNLLMSLDAGHGNYVSNEFNKRYAIDKIGAKVVLGSAIRVTFLSGAVQFILIIIMIYSGFIDTFFGSSLSEYTGVYAGLFWLVAYRMLFGSLMGILVRIMFPLGYFNRSVHIGTGEKILEIGLLFAAAVADWTLLTLCISYASLKAIYAIWSFILIRRWVSGFYPWWRYGNVSIGLRNYMKSMALMASYFMDRFSIDGISIIVSAILGPVMVPVLTTIRVITSGVSKVTMILLTPVKPEFSRYYMLKEWNKVIETFKTNWLLSAVLLNIPIILLTFFILPVYTYWTQGQLIFDMPLYILCLVSALLVNYGSGYIFFLRAINHIRALMVITFIRGLSMIVFSYILIGYFGLAGIGIALVVTELFSSLLIPSRFIRLLFDKVGAILNNDAKLIALVPILITVGILILIAVKPGMYTMAVVSFFLLFAVYFIQWKSLDPGVRQRMLRVTRLDKIFPRTASI